MKINFLLPVLLMTAMIQVYAQNIGIGILDPTRGKLEVQGAVGSTVAIFGGDGTGVSI